MNHHETLIKALRDCVDDWDGDFKFTATFEEQYDDFELFSVTVQHTFLGPEYEFRARVDSDAEVEMECGEDSWNRVSMGNLFAWLWFESVEHRKQAD